MSFDPRLKIGQILKNADIVETFKCGNMGGMRRSRTTNTLVIGGLSIAFFFFSQFKNY